MKKLNLFYRLLLMTILLCIILPVNAQKGDGFPSQSELERMSLEDWNNQIRREKFDIILPGAMRQYGVDMWIHIMRDAIDDPFGENDLGSASGVFVFTDTGEDRIERAVLGRRWGETQRQRGDGDTKFLENCGAYDIIREPVFVGEPINSMMTEYDYRFKGLREFIEERDPKVIAVNFRDNLGPWATSRRVRDGISYTDYRLLVQELGEKYVDRIVSSEYVVMRYRTSPVPSEIKLLKKMRKDEMVLVKKAFAEIKPGISKVEDLGQTGNWEVDVTVFRRMSTGQSQRTRSAGWEDAVVEGGDIIAAPSQGVFAYVLKDGEKEPPEEIRKLWKEYLKIDKIFAESVIEGKTSREIVKEYTGRFEEAGIIVKADQLHMFQPKNDFPVYSRGDDPEKTLISVDMHGKGMGATADKHDIYLGPRIGSYGPDWILDIPLAENHHFVLEYFFYMPSPGPAGKDQYLFFWDHEQVISTENGVEYLSTPQKELILIK